MRTKKSEAGLILGGYVDFWLLVSGYRVIMIGLRNKAWYLKFSVANIDALTRFQIYLVAVYPRTTTRTSWKAVQSLNFLER